MKTNIIKRALKPVSKRVRKRLSPIKKRIYSYRLAQSAYGQWLTTVLETKMAYKFKALYNGIQANRQMQINEPNFRRNIHRLEKGLIYPHPKSVFAESYILDTVKQLQLGTGIFDDKTWKWGHAVLGAYFERGCASEIVAQAYTLYQTLTCSGAEPNWIPYPAVERPQLTVDFEALHQLARRRRSVRFYEARSIDHELLRKAVQIASLSPSACNRQSFKFLFFDEPAFVKRLSEVPGGISGYELPAMVVVVGRYRGYFDERDVNAPLIDASLAVMSFLFALETLGLSSVCINWPNITSQEQQIRTLLHLDEDEYIVLLVGVGYALPEGKIPFSAKKNVDDLLEINPPSRIINK